MKRPVSLLGAAGLLAAAAAALLAGARPARADFTFVHLSDSHFTASTDPKANAAICGGMFRELRNLNPRPAFLVNTGDIVEAGTAVEYALYRKTKDENLGTDVRVYEAPGNHDSRWNPLGKEGFRRGTGQPLWQSWDQEKVHFVTLDSTVLLQHWGHFDRTELDWLAQDLKKVGRDRPVVLGFHHFFLQTPTSTAFVDNWSALLKVLAPYNVRLFLIGHGHSNIQWSINGVPAVMVQGLYQGAYNLIEVKGDTLTVRRRVASDPTKTQLVLTTSLARPKTVPTLKASAALQDGAGSVTVHADALPAEAKVAFTVAGKTVDLAPTGKAGDWAGAFVTKDWIPGVHQGLVTASAPGAPGDIAPVYVQPVTLNVPAAAGQTGPLWSVNVGGEVQTKLTLADGTLYVPTMTGTMAALDPATGKTRWRFKTGDAIFSVPLVSDGTVYFGSADHNVYAVDAKSGKLRWKKETGGGVFAGAAKAGDVVCIASTDKQVYGLDAATGAVRWTQPVGSLYQSAATTDGARFYLGGWDQMFRAFDAKTGAPVWANKFGRSFYYSPAIGSPTVGGGKAYVTSNDGLLHAVDTATGQVAWETPSHSLGYSGPLLSGGRIYNASLSDNGYVYAFDAATGQQIWRTPTGSVIYDSSCAMAGGNVYVGCVNGIFSALRASDGALQWQYDLGPGHLLASPATDENRVYIGNMDGQVYAFPAK